MVGSFAYTISSGFSRSDINLPYKKFINLAKKKIFPNKISPALSKN